MDSRTTDLLLIDISYDLHLNPDPWTIHQLTCYWLTYDLHLNPDPWTIHQLTCYWLTYDLHLKPDPWTILQLTCYWLTYDLHHNPNPGTVLLRHHWHLELYSDFCFRFRSALAESSPVSTLSDYSETTDDEQVKQIYHSNTSNQYRV